MDKDFDPYSVEYTFNIQSTEDFFNQLNNRSEEILKSYDCDDDLTLAQDMLRSIGVNV